MKTPTKIGVIVIGAMLVFGTGAYAADDIQAGKPRLDDVPAGDSPNPDPQKIMKETSVWGELVEIEGSTYVVKTAAGKKVRFQVDKNTTKLDNDKSRMGSDFKVGDKIDVQVAPNGHAVLIQMAMSFLPPEMMGKGPSEKEIARQNLLEQQRLEAKHREDPGTYSPEFKPEIGGQRKGGPGDFPQPAFPLIKGELKSIEGEFYVVQDVEGKEIRLHVDQDTKKDCGPDFQGTCTFSLGDKVEARRVSVTDDHAGAIRKLSHAEIAELAKAISPVGAASSDRLKDENVTLGGAKQAVRGEVVNVEGRNYVIKDHHGSETRVVINQNTRMWCGPETGSISGLLPEPSASDKPDATGQLQDQAGTAQQKDSDVGPGTKSSAGASMDCVFKAGDKIEAEVSDMGVATFIKLAGRAQPGQPLP